MPKTESTKRITVDLPAELHEQFSTLCFLHKPRLRMNHLIVEWVEKYVAEARGPAARAARRVHDKG